MSFVSPFVLPVEEYQRDLNLPQHYERQNAWYLAQQTGQPIDVVEDWLRAQLAPGGRFEFKDPILHHTLRQENGDRIASSSGVLSYIRDAVKNDDVIAPTLTRYKSVNVERSIQTGSIELNKALRSKNKKAMFQAERDAAAFEAAGDKERAAKSREQQTFFKIAQTGNKLSNNAVSGGYCSGSTIIYNPSAHTTLTSTCRITSGYGNANNEKLLSGNRHYYDIEVVINNIMSICHQADQERIERTCALYNLVIPSAEQVMELILRSLRLYRRDSAGEQRIWTLVSKLKPFERAAFAYTGDLYHIRAFNDEQMREFISALTRKVEEPHPDPDTVFAQVGDDYKTVACQINASFMNGKELGKLKGTREYALVAATLANMLEVLEQYRTFFATFFLTRCVPASLAYFPSAVRRTVLMSDTDSTIFTTQDWVQWATGSLDYNERSIGVCETMLFLASQSITHCLALMSANLGVERARLWEIAMKNEFRFDTFTPTPVAKHYYALIGRQELNSYLEFKTEIKGVHLKSMAKAPREVMEMAAVLMVDVSKRALRGESISMVQELQAIADMEHAIVKALSEGSAQYFHTQKIKPADTYKQPADKSNYRHYTMWQEVFEPKYGTVDPPPYPALKINTDIRNKSEWQAWLNGMADQELAARLRAYSERYHGGKEIRTFYIPKGYIIDKGVPAELLDVVNARRIVLDNTKVFYLVMESLGYCIVDGKISKLAMDMLPASNQAVFSKVA